MIQTDNKNYSKTCQYHGEEKYNKIIIISDKNQKEYLDQYVASYKQTHDTKNPMQAENSNPTPKVYQLKQDIYKYLVDGGMYDQVPQFIPDKHLTTAIGYIKGNDKRTIKKWKALREYGCIKISGPHQYEFI